MLRPRYRPQSPLLWRPAGRLQIGEGSHHVILPDATAAMTRWILSLDGLRDVAQIEQDLPIPMSDACRILRACVQAVAVEDAASMPHSWRWCERHARDAAQGDWLAAASTYGSTAHADEVIDRRARVRWWIRGSGILAEQSHHAFESSGMLPAQHEAGATLVVLADSLHPVHVADPRLQIPHLALGIYGDRAIIGPLVVPGVTSCLRCAYLHTRDADPSWPSLSVQLTRSIERMPIRPIDRLHAFLTSAQAALLARAWADHGEDSRAGTPSRGWRNRAIEIRLPDGRRTDHERPAHPLCGCAWAPRTSAPALAG
ncbi:MAG: hypothetical protein KGP12_01285 [Actinomycetales bacterium]|nr:hypothetical protein [Actinomycetales bacterium]